MAAAVLAAGCTPPPAARLKLAEDVARPPANAVIFFADGMDVQRLHEMLDAGLLPNIRRTFVDGGVEVRDAMSSMPSVTYPNCSAIVTGCHPGHHGILGNFWFDRGRLLIRNYMTLETARDVNTDLPRATIYDMLSDQLTVSLLAQTHKGVTVSFDMKSTFDLGWITGRYLWVDTQVGETFVEVADLANRVKRWPTVVMTYYPGVDEIGHRLGTDSSEYGDALVDFDNSVGRITRAIEAMGLAKTTRYAMIADHGMVPIRPGQNFEFIRWLARGRGLKVLNRPLEDSGYAARYEAIQAYDAVASVDAGRVAMIHLRGRNGWARRPDGEEARAWATAAPAIHDLEAVEMVAARAGADRASVWSRHGSVTIERRVESGRRLYRVAEASGDPLALRGSPALEEFARAGWHDSRDWLAASAGSRYPDLVPQVIEMFDSSHTGDLVVFAAEGWLLYPNEKAGHGSTLFRDMHVPMFFAGPGLPGGTQIPAGRLMDLVPTLLGLLGQADRLASFPPVDGIDLSEALRRAAPRDAALPAPTPARRLPAS